jgi:hypothetical protein
VDVLQWLLFGVLPAIAVVLLLVGVGGARWLALALALAVCAPLAMEDGRPPWPFELDLLRGPARPALWWVLLLSGAFGAAYDLRLLPRRLAVVFEAALVLALPWLLSAPWRAAWSFEACVLCLVVGWSVVLCLWWSVRQAAKVQTGLAVPLAMTLALVADAWLLRTRGAGADWQLAGVAAVALGFAVVTTAWRRPFCCGGGAALTMTLAHTGLLVCGRSAAELLDASFWIAWGSPLSLSLCALPWCVRSRRLGAVVACSGVAMFGALVVWSGSPQ